MAEIDRLRLANRLQTDYDGFGYALLFVPDLNAVAAVGHDVAAASLEVQALILTVEARLVSATGNDVTEAEAAAAAAAASLALAQAITGGAQGVGAAALMVPRNAELPPALWQGPVCIARGAAYQITPHDNQPRVLIAESGTLTWTLPLLSQLDPGWSVRVWNRSGNNLTINLAGTDVIGAAGTSVTVADGTGAVIAYGAAGARFERIG